MKKRGYEGLVVNYLDNNEIANVFNANEYYLAKTETDDVERIQQLQRMEFVFHERFLDYIIVPTKMDSRFIRMVRADVRAEQKIDKDMKELAQKAFVKDRRFHLKPYFEQESANKVISAYIDEISKEIYAIYKCFHKEKLVGFTMVKKVDDKTYENLLGAVDPEYQKKGVAFNLYVYMVDSLGKNGCEELIGSIAAANITSLNLHLMLGATFRGVSDQYIRR